MARTLMMVLLFLGGISAGVFASENLSYFENFGLAQTNYLVETMLDAYDLRDYDLFEACAMRLITLEAESSLSAFLDIFDKTDVGQQSSMLPMETGVAQYYFYASIQGIGAFGGDDEAQKLYQSYMHNEEMAQFYILQALGEMSESEKALTYLNEIAPSLDNNRLAEVCIEAIGKHASYSSLSVLLSMYDEPLFFALQSDIEEAISNITGYSK